MHEVFDLAESVSIRQDLSAARLLAKPVSQVGYFSHHPIVHAPFKPEISHGGIAGGQARCLNPDHNP